MLIPPSNSSGTFLRHSPIPSSISMSSQTPNLITGPSSWIPSSIDYQHSLSHTIVAHISSMVNSLDRPRSLNLQLSPNQSLLTQVENPSLIKGNWTSRASKDDQKWLRKVQSVSIPSAWLGSFGCDLFPIQNVIFKLTKVKCLWSQVASNVSSSE